MSDELQYEAFKAQWQDRPTERRFVTFSLNLDAPT